MLIHENCGGELKRGQALGRFKCRKCKQVLFIGRNTTANIAMAPGEEKIRAKLNYRLRSR